jgi:hypothetical protein
VTIQKLLGFKGGSTGWIIVSQKETALDVMQWQHHTGINTK